MVDNKYMSNVLHYHHKLYREKHSRKDRASLFAWKKVCYPEHLSLLPIPVNKDILMGGYSCTIQHKIGVSHTDSEV